MWGGAGVEEGFPEPSGPRLCKCLQRVQCDRNSNFQGDERTKTVRSISKRSPAVGTLSGLLLFADSRQCGPRLSRSLGPTFEPRKMPCSPCYWLPPSKRKELRTWDSTGTSAQDLN